ncbi:MAG: cytoskeleton protein RodZ [Sphingomonadales bacterium]|nr:cytoskeleton protein RodZ [Sphingomonadales bacterium]
MAEMDQEQDLPIGERLRLAREARGLSLDELAGQTRIPVRHLQHIEQGEWDALPAATYSVGFVRSYGNAVGLDGSALGAELRHQLGGARRAAMVSEYYEPADPARVPPKWLAITAAAIAVLLILAYLVFRSGVDGDGATALREEQKAAAQPAPRSAQPTAQPQNLAGQPVVLTAVGPVWLRITQGGGTVVTERTLAAGETYRLPAGLDRPLLRVGAPEALRISVGQTAIRQLGPSGQPIGNVSLVPEELAVRAQAGGPAQPPRQ